MFTDTGNMLYQVPGMPDRCQQRAIRVDVRTYGPQLLAGWTRWTPV